MSGVIAAQASAQAANKSYALGTQQLAFEKQLWQHDRPMLDQITHLDIGAQKQQNQFSRQMQGTYEHTFIPLEKKYSAQAQNWATPAQEKLNAGAAEGMVANQFEGQRNAAMQQLEGFGVDPTSTRYAALDIGSRAQEGAAQAAAGTSAIQQTKLQGLGLENSAIAAGQGNAAGSIGATNAATGAGSGGSGATIGGFNAATSGMTAPTAWFNAGANNMNVYTNAVNGFNIAQNQAAQIQNQSMQGIGSMLGGVMGMMMEDGGPVPESPSQGIPDGNSQPTEGGGVAPQMSPSRGQAIDDVPARLTAGEFVLPRDVVNWYGQKHFVDTIDKARQGQQKLQQRSDVGGRAAPAIPAPPAFVSRPPMQAIPVGMR